MLDQIITLYTSEIGMIMLAGALFILGFPIFPGKNYELLPINNVIRLIPVVSEFVYAGRQSRMTGYEACIIPYKIHNKLQFRDHKHRLG